MDQVIQGHLGGYVPGGHGDEATYFPDLWTWLVEGPLQIKTVLDIGCGEGHSLKFFRELGCGVTGVDGIDQDDPDIIKWDFTTGPVDVKATYDLVWMCEFVEHVDEEYVHNILSCVQAGKIVLMTHAFPGQGGHHHVNCREAEYWKGFMTAAGFGFSQGLTDKTREVAAKNPSPWNHYFRSGLAFRRLDTASVS